MPLPRLDTTTHIADRLNELAAKVKTRSRANLTDANRILETIAARFFNALFGWDLVNLNIEQSNYPAADLGNHQNRIAIQVTNEDGSDKIKHTASKAVEHKLANDFDRLIIFFLLPKKPGFPKNFIPPAGCPKIETWDIADLLKQLQDLPDLETLTEAAKVLDEEMGKIAKSKTKSIISAVVFWGILTVVTILAYLKLTPPIPPTWQPPELPEGTKTAFFSFGDITWEVNLDEIKDGNL